MRVTGGRPATGPAALYLVYGIAATVFFLYLGFPFTRMEQWAIARIAQTTSVLLEPHERRLSFPLHLHWGSIGLKGLQDGSSRPLQGEQVSVDVALLPLMEQRLSAAIRFRLLEGEVMGVAEWQGRREPLEYHLQGSARELDLSRLGSGISEGRLQGQWEYRWNPSEALRGQGLLTVEITRLRLVAGLSSGATFPALTFQKVNGRIVLNKGVGMVEDLRVEGDEVWARGGGSILLRNPVGESQLNLTLQVRLRDGLAWGEEAAWLKTALASAQGRLVVKGTVRRPAFFLNDLPLSALDVILPSGKVG